MIALLPALPLPELAVLALVLGLPAGVALLFWPLMRRGNRLAPSLVTPVMERTAAMGLTGQWIVLSASLQTMTARSTIALSLHENATRRLGALDYEVNCLWRETTALGRALDVEIPASSVIGRPRPFRQLIPAARQTSSTRLFRLAS